jgi:hypothetical protein
MEQKQCEKWGRQRGSATLEAVVGFTAFLLAIFTILGMVNFCRAQMLISAAMDAAAKEMAQYSYFYEMSGLRKLEGKLDTNGAKGRENINGIIGTVDNLYSSITGAVDQTVQEKNNVQNMINAGQLDTGSIENSIQNIENSAQGIGQGIAGVTAAFKDVGNDPLLYMRSIVALLGSEGAEAAKRVIAVPLTRSFVSKHFGENAEEANAKLKALGIDGGLDGINFNLSKLFSDENQQDIELIAFYKVKLVQVFDWVLLEAKVSKVASCRAWLGGDDVIVKVSPSTDTSSGGDKPTDDATDNSTESTESTESTDPTEETTDNAGTAASTGNWALQHDPTFYDGSERWDAFRGQLQEDYYTNNSYGLLYYRETEGKTVGYNYSVSAKWEYEPYQTIGGNTVDPGPNHIATEMREKVLDTANTPTNRDGSVQEFGAYTHVIYVPENMPQDQYDRLVADAEKAKAQMEEMIQNDTTGVPKDLKINVLVVRSGGTYDYNSSEGDYNNIGGEG